ncbi:MAG TPA: glycosyltransferase, partial [Candidatus Saccharimonadales bacterium]|nr:glycosyltransferase [Candidatus Saccharimonadales bacterium]
KNKFKNYFLVVSRLVKYKKVDLVVETFNELESPLLVIGTGREEKKLKRKAKKNIHFIGHVRDEELATYYKNARALIFPQEEDFGITAVEAQMYGIPVIAYKKGGAMDTVNRQTGVFFDEQNKKSLLDAIYKFGKRKFNKKVIKENAKKFSKRRFKNEFLQLIKSL